MSPVAIFLLAIAGIFLLGALGELIFERTNIPDVVWLILAGILLGPVLGLVTREQLNGIAPYFAALTLVVVLFEGGSALRLADLSRAAPRSGLLALFGFVSAVVAVALLSSVAAAIGWLPAGWTGMHSILLGTIVGGSSSIIIMPAMAQAKVETRLANLVNLESALTDALCVVGTSALLDVMVRGTTGAGAPLYSLLRSFAIGLALGTVAGLFWLLFLRFLHSKEHAYPITLAALLGMFVLIDKLGGSAALGILAIAVILGNAPALGKKIGLAHEAKLDTDVQGFHRQLAFMIKSFFFVFIGAMLGPPWSMIAFGVLLGGALLVARIPAVYAVLYRSSFTPLEKKVATVSLPRGMAAGVLATLPVAAGVAGTEEVPVAVFSCVCTSIMIFAVGFPWIRRTMPQLTEQMAADLPAPAGIARSPGASEDKPVGVAERSVDAAILVEHRGEPPEEFVDSGGATVREESRRRDWHAGSVDALANAATVHAAAPSTAERSESARQSDLPRSASTKGPGNSSEPSQ